MKTPKVLTIAGSDSSGGAGIAADLKTFAKFNIYGAAVITAITAQNKKEVRKIFPVPAPIISTQLETTLQEIKPDAVKTAMLYNTETIKVISSILRKYKIKNLLIDPVMTSTSGKILLKKSAIKMLIKKLFPLSILVTPNIEEAQKLANIEIKTPIDIKTACIKINKLGAENILIKGGHFKGESCSDILYFENKFYTFTLPRLKSKNIRATGCALSAAISCYIATGFNLPSACKKAKKFVYDLIHSYKY